MPLAIYNIDISLVELQDQFIKAVLKIKTLTKKPSDVEHLQLYALYKQATEGDIHGIPPAGFDFKAIAKYNSWQQLQGTSKEDAMQQYCALVEKISNSTL